MRSVLVCLRSAFAEQAVANAAAQLGLSDIIATAAGGAEALAKVSRSPADILLVDTASVRPDTVGFTRRVLERSPDAVVVFFGPEEPDVAQAAVAAGARGLIRGEREELVASVAKALMLLLRGGRSEAPSTVPLQRSEPENGEDETAAAVEATGTDGAAPTGTTLAAPATARSVTFPGPPAGTNGVGSGAAAGDGVAGVGAVVSGGTVVPSGTAGAGGAGSGASVVSGRRLALTERELQVLRGMAEGKSNAEIGRELFVSEDTVKTHARRLFRKLGARDRAHAVAAAFRAGLVR